MVSFQPHLSSSLTLSLACLWKTKETGVVGAAGRWMGSEMPAGVTCLRGCGSFQM